MRKVLINKYFFLSLIIALGLSGFSFFAYKNINRACSMTKQCCTKSVDPLRSGEMIWDAVSGQFNSLISFQ